MKDTTGTIGPVTFRLPRHTGTHGDVLAAVGLADLVQAAVDTPVRLEDGGDHFLVRLSTSFGVDDLPTHPGYPYLRPNVRTAVPPAVKDVVDYPTELERVKRYREAVQTARKSKQPVPEWAEADRPRPDWRLLQVLNTLQGDETSNKVHLTLVTDSTDHVRRDLARGLRALLQGEPSDLSWPASQVQLFAPNAAKGYARLKPDSTGRNDKTKEQWTDPFLELLKYRGYFRVACPFFTGKDGKDVRFLCPVPGNISLPALRAVAARLRNLPLGGGPAKLDSLAVLRLAQILIDYSEDFGQPGQELIPDLTLARASPGKVVSELAVTHYQSLGQSRAISGMFALALPAWFDIDCDEDAQDWRAILREHSRVIQDLRDDHSDEIDLLLRYRRFLERRGESAAWEFIGFLEHYGPFLMRAREQKRRLWAFEGRLVRRVIVSNCGKLSAILDDPGFCAVAAAVRRATVSAQEQKAMGRDYREIRYELLHDLRRKRSLPGTQLAEAVAVFVSLYNSENARRRELGKRAPRNVTTEELAQLVALIDEHGPSIVGALLCAYGSCRQPQQPGEPIEAPDADVEEAVDTEEPPDAE